MGRTERRLLATASIALALALTAGTAGAVPAGLELAAASSSAPSESPAAFAERAAGGVSSASVTRGASALRGALELIVLAAVCAIVVAVYSATEGERSEGGLPSD